MLNICRVLVYKKITILIMTLFILSIIFSACETGPKMKYIPKTAKTLPVEQLACLLNYYPNHTETSNCLNKVKGGDCFDKDCIDYCADYIDGLLFSIDGEEVCAKLLNIPCCYGQIYIPPGEHNIVCYKYKIDPMRNFGTPGSGWIVTIAESAQLKTSSNNQMFEAGKTYKWNKSLGEFELVPRTYDK